MLPFNYILLSFLHCYYVEHLNYFIVFQSMTIISCYFCLSTWEFLISVVFLGSEPIRYKCKSCKTFKEKYTV